MSKLTRDIVIDRIKSGETLAGENLSGLDLNLMILQGTIMDGADLRRTNLQNANLTGASMEGSSLEGASLEWAILEGANLDGSTLIAVRLDGANLTGAYLRGASMEVASLEGANLQDANLRGANLQGADLVGARGQRANLQEVNMQEANLYRANLEGADMEGASLQEVDLQTANLIGAKLIQADLRGANLQEVNMQGAHLNGAHLNGANLEGANLEGANLEGADLRRVGLLKTDLQGANLEGANLIGTNLWEAYYPPDSKQTRPVNEKAKRLETLAKLKRRKTLTRQANLLFDEKRWEEAIAINETILGEFPNDLHACNRRGLALAELGRKPEAQQVFEGVLRRDPDNKPARTQLNRLLGYPQGVESNEVQELDWEVLPPGWWKVPQNLSRIRGQFPTQPAYSEFIERLEYAEEFKPVARFISKFPNGGYTYYVFLFPNHVLAECPQYGNAAYILKGRDGWESIFKHTRQELRDKFPDRIERVIHKKTWKKHVARLLN